ncbi:MAG: hypothetical protein NTV56_01175 [Alphaproteobacteria bacterium]|nr:hypothetical protein [Alphaproteobacteria bacterium]
MAAPMTADEANKLGVLPSERSSYFKTGASKSNLSPRSDDAPWYQLHSVTLPNPEPPSYMTGDRVQAVTRVQLSPTSMPPSGDYPKIRRAILDVVAAGKMIDGQCVPYSPNTSGVNNQLGFVNHASLTFRIVLSHGVLTGRHCGAPSLARSGEEGVWHARLAD